MKLTGASNPKMQGGCNRMRDQVGRKEGLRSRIDVSQISHEIARGKKNGICERAENKQKTTSSNTGHEVVVQGGKNEQKRYKNKGEYVRSGRAHQELSSSSAALIFAKNPAGHAASSSSLGMPRALQWLTTLARMRPSMSCVTGTAPSS